MNVSRRAPLRDDHARRWTAPPATPRSPSSTRAASTASSLLEGDPNAPTCKECHGTHGDRWASCRAASPTFPTNVPELCARCHREGEKAAVRYTGAAARDHRALHREHPRQGAAEERPHRDRHLHGLPHRPRRAAADRPRLERQPRERARRPAAGATTASRSSSRRASTTTLLGKTDKELPVCNDCHTRAHDPARRRRRLQARHHAEVRPLPRARSRRPTSTPTTARCQPARLHEDGQVLRLPRRPRHPAGHRPALAPLARERGRDLPEVPPGRDPALRRLPDPRHPPRPEEVPVALLDLLGHDRRCWSAPSSIGGAHTLLWLPRALQMRRELKEAEEAEERELEQQSARARREPTPGPTTPATRAGGQGIATWKAASRPKALQFQRFTRLNRALHALMIVSFISLALTGMTLKFSYTGWAAFLVAPARRLRERGLHPPRGGRPDVRPLRHPPLGPEPQAQAGARRLAPEAAPRPRLDALQQAGPPGVRRHPQVVRGARARGRATGAGPTGRSSTTSRSSGASS